MVMFGVARFSVLIILQRTPWHVSAAIVPAAILKCQFYLHLYRLPQTGAEHGRGSSGIGRGKSIRLAEGIILPAEAVELNRSRPCLKAPNRKFFETFHGTEIAQGAHTQHTHKPWKYLHSSLVLART